MFVKIGFDIDACFAGVEDIRNNIASECVETIKIKRIFDKIDKKVKDGQMTEERAAELKESQFRYYDLVATKYSQFPVDFSIEKISKFTENEITALYDDIIDIILNARVDVLNVARDLHDGKIADWEADFAYGDILDDLIEWNEDYYLDNRERDEFKHISKEEIEKITADYYPFLAKEPER